MRVWVSRDTTLSRDINGTSFAQKKQKKTRDYLFFEIYKMVLVIFKSENCSYTIRGWNRLTNRDWWIVRWQWGRGLRRCAWNAIREWRRRSFWSLEVADSRLEWWPALATHLRNALQRWNPAEDCDVWRWTFHSVAGRCAGPNWNDHFRFDFNPIIYYLTRLNAVLRTEFNFHVLIFGIG